MSDTARAPISSNQSESPSHPDQARSRTRGLGRRLFAGAIAATLLASLTVLGVSSPAQAAGTYQTTASSITVREGPGTGYKPLFPVGSGVSFVLNCQYQGGTNIGGNSTWDSVQFSDGRSGVITDFFTNTPSWNNYAPGTGNCSPTGTSQMQAAAAWAIAEKNSPDPTWSDHFHYAWSGHCEAFAEQAEGFPHAFPTATANYNWERASGRIHTDAAPPPGALVFYGGGNGAGHVAVSIGGGQEIGTYGFVGQRLAVRQYPVIGYLSNPYLGWAFPWGS